jgi:hypothetical protein
MAGRAPSRQAGTPRAQTRTAPAKARRAAPARQQQDGYQENLGWGNVFYRPDNEGNQPDYTGQGVDLDGNDIEIAVWVKKSRRGTEYLRIHLRAPYETDTEEEADDDNPNDDDEDVPF